MRSLVINKILPFRYRFGKFLGKGRAGRICIVLERDFRSYSEGRSTMAESEQLMEGLIRFGREAVQDYVTRSQDIGDTMRYIRAEQCLEIVRLTSFVTTNQIDFERKRLPPTERIETRNLNESCIREREV